MRLIPILIAALASPAAAQPAPLRVPGPLSPRNASYQITARLDETAHTVTGQAVLSWRNLERHPADRLVFHLYLNAFKNLASTFMREAGPQLRGLPMPERGFGAIDVTALRVAGRDLLARAVVDDTLMTVPLPEPVGPSAAVEVVLAFKATLPRLFARSGYAGDFHAVAQWFPKIGVFDCQGDACAWRAHQYHGYTEFFADYGVYDVELDVPARLVVGATGVLTGERQAGGRRVLRYRAEDVHDFVWMADPRFIEHREVVSDEWGQVVIRLLSLPGQEAMVPRHLGATRGGLLELERRFGVYPYSNVTVVVPPKDGQGAGGMEYPTLFTTVLGDVPEGVRVPEMITLHELGHQYFYGIVGTDEIEEAFLDEGFNEAFTTWGVERLYGTDCNLVHLGALCLSLLDASWLQMRRVLRQVPIATPGFAMPPGAYSGVTYAQTALTLRTLERHLGPARMEAGMRRYVDRYRFRHPRRADFIAAFDEGAGEDLRWFWDQALTTSRAADFQVLRARSERHEPAAGLWDCPPRPPATTDPQARALIEEAQALACAGKPPGRHELPEKARKDALYDSEVLVHRRGELLFPVAVRMTFADGSTVHETWGLAEQQRAPEVRVRRYTYARRPRLKRVEVDPERTLLLDERRLNNGLLLQPDRGPARRIAAGFLGLLQALCDLMGT